MMPSDFLKILSRAAMLKTTTRHCVTEKNRKESVADHSWPDCFNGHAIVERTEFQDTDMNKVIRMCLIHDLGETFTGDVPAFERQMQIPRTKTLCFMIGFVLFQLHKGWMAGTSERNGRASNQEAKNI